MPYSPILRRSIATRASASLLMVACVVLPFAGCGEEPVVAPEDRMVRVSLDAADREAIGDPRYAVVLEAIIGIRRLESAAPPQESESAAIAAHADQVAEATRAAVAIMADERWTREERRMMQRVLRYATLQDLNAEEMETQPADG